MNRRWADRGGAAAVGQTFLSASSRDIPVPRTSPGSTPETGDRNVASTGRQECRPYGSWPQLTSEIWRLKLPISRNVGLQGSGSVSTAGAPRCLARNPGRRGSALALAVVLGFLGPIALAQPANDQFANRIALSGTNLVIQGTTVGALPDAAEPYERTVWWEWTAPAEGQAMIAQQYNGGSVDLSVYTGTSLAELQPVVSSSPYAPVIFPVTAGTKYQLAVGSSYQIPVSLTLRFIPHPPNESFAGRIPLGTGDAQISGAFGGSTNRSLDPIDDRTFGTVWYSWTAATSGPVTLKLDVELGGMFGYRSWVHLSVLTGDQEDQLVPVALGRTGSYYEPRYGSDATFQAQAGTAYQIAVSGKQFPGDFTLSVLRSTAPEVMLMEPPPGSVFHQGETIPLRAVAFDPESRVAKVDFYQSYFSASIGEALEFFQAIGSDATWPFAFSWKPETPGHYWLTARAEDDSGARRSSPKFLIVVRPANDDFAQRITLTGASLTVTGFCGSATREVDEPDSFGLPTVWWSWTAPQTGPVTLTSDSAYSLAVFTGAELTNLTLVSSAMWDSLAHARLAFSATAGTTYQIAVTVSSPWEGPSPVQLTLTPSLPPAITITSPTNYATLVSRTDFEVLVNVVPGGAPIARVEFYSDGYLLGTSTNAPYSFTITNAGSTFWGGYHLQARVVDAAGLDARTEEVVLLAQPPSPPNDNFTNRLVLVGASVTATGALAYATSEPGEPSPGYSVWWSWTAPASGIYTVTDANRYDTVSIFTGSAVTNLTTVVVATYMNGFARAALHALAGTEYAFDVSGNGVAQLSIVRSAPPTVRFLTPTNTTDLVSGQPLRLEVEAADSDGVVTNVDFYLWRSGVGYRWLGAATNPPYTITVSLDATNWFIDSLWAYATDNAGLVTSSEGVDVTVHPPPAGNDNFAQRIELTGSSLVLTGTTEYATREPGELDYNQHSVWWSWTAPTSGPVSIAFTQAEAATYLTVYAGDSLSNLTQVAQLVNPDWWLPGWLTFNAQAGTNYKIAVSSWGSAVALRLAMSQPPTVALRSPTNQTVVLYGTSVTFEAEASDPEGALSRVDFYVDFSLVGTATHPPYRFEFSPRWPNVAHGLVAIATDDQGLSTRSSEVQFTVMPPPAPNDDFARRLPLRGFMASAGWDSANYTDGAAWWSWTAPASGVARIIGDNAALRSIRICTGADTADSPLVLLREGSTQGFTFDALAGMTYQIAVEHWRFDIYLSWHLALDCPQAAQIDGLAIDAKGEARLHVTTLSQQPWWLQASTNLVDWQTISTNSSGNQVFTLTDPTAGAAPQRFYRLINGTGL